MTITENTTTPDEAMAEFDAHQAHAAHARPSRRRRRLFSVVALAIALLVVATTGWSVSHGLLSPWGYIASPSTNRSIFIF